MATGKYKDLFECPDSEFWNIDINCKADMIKVIFHEDRIMEKMDN